jgi:transposase
MPNSTTLEERLKIVEWSEKGEPAWRISRRLGWQESTVRKWRNRDRQQGRAGLVSHMGRPPSGALSNYSVEIREVIEHWRNEHPGWGADTLLAELKRHPNFREQKLPSAASISRFLREQGWCKPQDRHSELPDSNRKQSGSPHDIWEMDARGYQYIPDIGMIALINLNDRFSHVRLLSYPCQLGEKRVIRHANTADYQVALRLAFTTWGRPFALQVDHESVFFDNKTKSPFPTQLHLWLRALDVKLTFGRVHRPTDQAMTERSHQLWAGQVLAGQQFPYWQALYDALQDRRDFLNNHLPCSSLNQLPPLVAYPQAKHSDRFYRPEYEADILNLQPVYEYLAQGRWFRRVASNGIISLGGYVYYVGATWRRQQVEIRFDTQKQEFLCLDEAGNLIKQFPWKKDLREHLIGDSLPICNLPSFQLHLPLAWEDVRLQHFLRVTRDTAL